MPELCRIYIPMMNRDESWFLKTHIIFFKGTVEGWKVTIDDEIITVQDYDDMQRVVDFVADHNGWFTDYREAKNYIARQR